MIYSILLALTIVSIFTTIWLWDIVRFKGKKLGINSSLPYESDNQALSVHTQNMSDNSMSIVRYEGDGELPMRVYEGDSKNITLDFKRTAPLSKAKVIETLVFFRNTISKTKDGVSIIVQVTKNRNLEIEEYLELEMIAAGFMVEGDKKQNQLLTYDKLHYQWNCYYPNSGNHNFALVFRLINSKHIIEVGRIEQTTSVVKLDHMTQRQVWNLATLAGIISGGLALLETLHQLGIW